VMAAFGRARVQAMSTGVAQAFRFQPGTGQYTVMATVDASQGVDSDASGMTSAMAGPTLHNTTPTSSGGGFTTSDPSPAPTTVTPGSSSAGSSSRTTGSCGYQLIDGYAFTKGDRVLDTRAAVTESMLADSQSSDGTSETAPPVLFYPDGTTSDATVTIGDKT